MLLSILSYLTIIYIIFIKIHTISCDRLTEQERIANWYHNNNTWPPNWQPERSLFTINMAKREIELQLLPGIKKYL